MGRLLLSDAANGVVSENEDFIVKRRMEEYCFKFDILNCGCSIGEAIEVIDFFYFFFL